jgi:hypothetical protein
MTKRNKPTGRGFTLTMLWVFALAAASSFLVSLATGKFHPGNPYIDQKRFLRTEDPTHYWTLVMFMGVLTLTLTSGACYLSYCALVHRREAKLLSPPRS